MINYDIVCTCIKYVVIQNHLSTIDNTEHSSINSIAIIYIAISGSVIMTVKCLHTTFISAVVHMVCSM